MKGIIDKERLKEIGRYLERQIIIHRNVENDTKWNKEESMIVDLFDNYVELICEINNLQKENQQLKQQQEEFINYLKSMLDNDTDIFSVARVIDILEKYKKIIVSDK